MRRSAGLRRIFGGMTPRRRHNDLAAATLALALVAAPASAQPDPCRDPIIADGLARAAQGAVKPILLYDGRESEARRP